MKSIHIIWPVISALLLLASQVLAFDIVLKPEGVAPGDVFYIELEGRGDVSATADFMGRSYELYPMSGSRLVGLVPVDITTGPGTYRLTVQRGDEKRTADMTVLKHEFETIKLTLPKGKVTLSPENQKRATREAVLLNKIWPQSTGKKWDGSFSAPTNTEISTLFGVKRIMNEVRTSVHRGMDFRGKTGTPVKAINGGTALLIDELFFGGNTLIVDHGMGLYSVYMHLSEIKVARGEKVAKGQVVGLIGMSGRATGPHLHLSVKLNGTSINPDSLFRLEL